MFIISITYTANLDQIDRHLEEHVAFLDKHYAQGDFVLSGRKIPRVGGVIISTIASRSNLDSVLEQDPFYRENLASYEVTEMVPTKTAVGLEFLLEG